MLLKSRLTTREVTADNILELERSLFCDRSDEELIQDREEVEMFMKISELELHKRGDYYCFVHFKPGAVKFSTVYFTKLPVKHKRAQMHSVKGTYYCLLTSRWNKERVIAIIPQTYSYVKISKDLSTAMIISNKFYSDSMIMLSTFIRRGLSVVVVKYSYSELSNEDNVIVHVETETLEDYFSKIEDAVKDMKYLMQMNELYKPKHEFKTDVQKITKNSTSGYSSLSDPIVRNCGCIIL
jgi:hypothetical protein